MGSACVSVPDLVLERPQALSSLPSSEERTLARRTFDVIDIVEILIHWYAGRSQNELAASTSGAAAADPGHPHQQPRHQPRRPDP